MMFSCEFSFCYFQSFPDICDRTKIKVFPCLFGSFQVILEVGGDLHENIDFPTIFISMSVKEISKSMIFYPETDLCWQKVEIARVCWLCHQ